jgi:hypothetical protein
MPLESSTVWILKTLTRHLQIRDNNLSAVVTQEKLETARERTTPRVFETEE